MESNEMGDSTAGKVCLASMVDSGSIESRRYYLARRTLIEMLRDRGYLVANMEEELRRSLADFRAVYGDKPEPERLRLIAGRTSLSSKKILVIFCEVVEINKKNMIGILSQVMNKEMLEKVILIVQGKVNYHAQKFLSEYPVKTETFHIAELLVNITKHVLVPKHEVLTPDKKEKLLKKYSIEGKQLPMMSETDAIARYYGLEKGQVVKASYSGGIPDSIVTYRCVV